MIFYSSVLSLLEQILTINLDTSYKFNLPFCRLSFFIASVISSIAFPQTIKKSIFYALNIKSNQILWRFKNVDCW